MPKPSDAIKEQDRLRERVVSGLRAEQALPFIRPYLDLRRAELLASLKYYADASNHDKVFETSIRLSEIETILVQLKTDTQTGRKADAKLAAAHA